jgi:hypothetical protein
VDCLLQMTDRMTATVELVALDRTTVDRMVDCLLLALDCLLDRLPVLDQTLLPALDQTLLPALDQTLLPALDQTFVLRLQHLAAVLVDCFVLRLL